MSTDPHQIALDDAVRLCAAHRDRHPDAITAWGFPRDVLDRLLAVKGMTGIRIYAAEAAEGQTVVLVATDAEGRDLVTGYLAEQAYPCPPKCDRSSPLQG